MVVVVMMVVQGEGYTIRMGGVDRTAHNHTCIYLGTYQQTDK